jgi:hypothetical protein
MFRRASAGTTASMSAVARAAVGGTKDLLGPAPTSPVWNHLATFACDSRQLKDALNRLSVDARAGLGWAARRFFARNSGAIANESNAAVPRNPAMCGTREVVQGIPQRPRCARVPAPLRRFRDSRQLSSTAESVWPDCFHVTGFLNHVRDFPPARRSGAFLPSELQLAAQLALAIGANPFDTVHQGFTKPHFPSTICEFHCFKYRPYSFFFIARRSMP